VDATGRVREFAGTSAGAPVGALTFTGIQVLDPVVLDYIPGHGFHHSIDAFRAMIAAGLTIQAFFPDQGDWNDVGTPARYRQTAVEASAREAWQQAFAGAATERLVTERIEGDGSDRQWSRWKGTGGSMVLADHGLRTTSAVAEVDAFVADADGFVYLVGRFKDMIRRSGENIAAREVEAVVRLLPQVADCAAVPVPDAKRGEEVKILVQLQPGSTLDAAALVEHCRAHLAAFKLPRYVQFVAEFPRTSSNKIAKSAIAAAPGDPTAGCFDRDQAAT
jgi:acyl-CoA synthetase (AMP-forming)/AMP-acid ligase II